MCYAPVLSIRLDRIAYLLFCTRHACWCHPSGLITRPPRVIIASGVIPICSKQGPTSWCLTGPSRPGSPTLHILPMRDKNVYLSLITDAWSRKIVGYPCVCQFAGRRGQPSLEHGGAWPSYPYDLDPPSIARATTRPFIVVMARRAPWPMAMTGSRMPRLNGVTAFHRENCYLIILPIWRRSAKWRPNWCASIIRKEDRIPP